MHRTLLLGILSLTIIHCYGGGVSAPFEDEESADDLQAQIRDLQLNVSDVWVYIRRLRNAVSNHLTHLREHQVELESFMHTMEHIHENELHSSGYHHSGDHSHSGEQHAHSGEHSHGSDHGHGSMEQHSHSGEQHSHSDEQHSHSGEHHSHSGEHGHHSYSHSHSHTSHDDHSTEDSHSHVDDHHHHDHHHDHDSKDVPESEDIQTQQVIGPPATALKPPVIRQEHYHHSSHHGSADRDVPGGIQTQRVVGPPAESVVPPTVREEHYHHHGHDISSDDMNLMREPFHHHHHRDENRNRTVVLPRHSDYGQYNLASCRVLPNRAIPENQQQDVMGTVTLWQKKTGGPLNIHVRLQGFDVGGHHGHHQQALQQDQDNEAQTTVGHRHGFHIHASGDLSNGCQSAGPHYNPKGVNHGGPRSLVRHVGDLGNIECDEHGNTNIMFSDDVASLTGQHSVIGKAIVIHGLEDDLGLGGDEESLRTGNAGTRLACCVIEELKKIPLRQYKVMKSATQYQNR